MDRAILPASPPQRQWSRAGSVRSGYKKDITTSRSASATSTIQNSELLTFPAGFGLRTSCSNAVLLGNAIRSNRSQNPGDEHLLCHNKHRKSALLTVLYFL
jgi:hypothetical protein